MFWTWGAMFWSAMATSSGNDLALISYINYEGIDLGKFSLKTFNYLSCYEGQV